jgi:hypothetical protein
LYACQKRGNRQARAWLAKRGDDDEDVHSKRDMATHIEESREEKFREEGRVQREQGE